jgi:hypothetical protein
LAASQRNCPVGDLPQLIGSNQSIKPFLERVFDDGRNVEADHPLRAESIRLLDVVIGFQSELPGCLAEYDCLGNIQVDRDGPVGAFPVVKSNG